MKKTIVKTDNYLLVVDDSVIKDVRPYKGKWHLEKGYILNRFPIYLTDLSECKLVISHLPLNDAPILEGVPLLPPLEVEDDVWSLGLKERLDELPYTKHLDDGGYNDGQVVGFENGAEWGYNKAREKYKFTEEDMMEAMLKICDYYADSLNTEGVLDGYKFSKEIIKSLSQPKTPTHFEFEMERGDLPYYVIKTTTNSQGQEVACGQYTFAS